MRRTRERPRVWRIDRQEDGRVAYVGVVTAASEDTAIQRACEKFGIDLEDRRELIVREM
jgi:hypothetical protein